MSKDPFIRILIIDEDEESYRHAYEMLMATSKEKYKIDHASSYEEGLLLAKKKKHDIYLVDSTLGSPGKTGIDLIRESTALGYTAPHVLLTSNENEPFTDEVYNAGVMDRIDKTRLTPNMLENTIMFCLRHSKVVDKTNERNRELEEIIRQKTLEQCKKFIESDESTEIVLRKEKELNELKSRLMLMVTHEFRTPLSIILSSSDLIKRYKKNEQQQDRERHIDRIKTCIFHLTAVLDDFILLDRYDTEHIPVQNKIVEIDMLCKRIVGELDEVMPGKPEVMYTHAGTTRSVMLDEQLLETIIRHLLLNAIKFSADTSQIEFSSSLNDNMLEICVTDHGIGIPEAEQKHIFERFFRAKNVLNIPGTGIGLNLVAGYVNKMNGAVTFQSVEGEGSEFKLVFPEVHTE